MLPPYDEACCGASWHCSPTGTWPATAGHADDAAAADAGASLRAIVEQPGGPSVFVHRDFMPRNLMQPVTPGGPLGVLDFQDAVYGPITTTSPA